MTRPWPSASRWFTRRCSGSGDSSPFSTHRAGRATAASTRLRRRPSLRRAAPSPASWAWCPGSWACCRPTRRSRSCCGSVTRWPGACCSSMRSTHRSQSFVCGAIPLVRSALSRPSRSATRSSSCRLWQAVDGLMTALRRPAPIRPLEPLDDGERLHAYAHARMAPHGGRYEDILDAIGHTPLVEISRMSPNPNVRLFAKLEAVNPTGSVKDRVAKYLVEDLEHRGLLRPDSIILEPTSGNTGIALAMIGRRKGYRVALVMPDNVTNERRQMAALFGAEVIDSPGHLGSNGAIALAKHLVERDERFVMPYQYGNEAN